MMSSFISKPIILTTDMYANYSEKKRSAVLAKLILSLLQQERDDSTAHNSRCDRNAAPLNWFFSAQVRTDQKKKMLWFCRGAIFYTCSVLFFPPVDLL